MDQAYPGFLQFVKDKKKQKIVLVGPEKTTTGCDVEKPFHEDMPKSIKAILLDHKNIFPIDLPPQLWLLQNGSWVQDWTGGQYSTHS